MKKVSAAISSLARTDSEELTRRANGRLRYVAALTGLIEHDDQVVGQSLEDACRGLPELSSEAFLVARRMQDMARNRSERLHHLAAAAELWPDQRADTPLFLRATAILLALRIGRMRTAVRLVSGWPFAATLGFVGRTMPLWRRLAGTTIGAWTHWSRETIYER